MAQITLHRGGWTATKAELAAVPVPPETDHYVPVPYARFLEEVELHLPRFGLSVRSEAYALARGGAQMFGVLTCTNGAGPEDVGLAIGLRNSYDRSLAAQLLAGTRIFVCDNLAFAGEAKTARKHTTHVFRDLPELIYRMLGSVRAMEERTLREIAAMKARVLTALEADHLMVESVRRRVLPASHLPRVLALWHRPVAPVLEEEQSAWRLFNAFTEVLKSRSPRLQMENSLRLTGVFRGALDL